MSVSPSASQNLSTTLKLEAQVGQNPSPGFMAECNIYDQPIRLIMICYSLSCKPSLQSDQIAFSNPESDVV